MSNLIEQIMKMEEGLEDIDALILQPSRVKPNLCRSVDYHRASAIIRKIDNPGGVAWGLHALSYSPALRGPITGSGIYGDINYIVEQAEKQFGIKSDVREWVAAAYFEPDYPINLIP